MIFHWIALFCFLTAFTLHWVYVRQQRYLSRIKSYPIMLCGFLALTVYLIQRGLTIQACPIGNPFEIISFIIWSSVFFYMLVGLIFSVNYLGFFTAGLSSLTLVTVHFFPGLNYAYGVDFIHSNHLIGVHASLAIFSYGFFALLALLAAMYQVQYYGLTRHRSGSFFSILPPLVKLEKLQTGVLAVGVFIMSLALFVGSFSFFRDIGDIPVYKLITAVFVWVYYAAILVFRLFNRLMSSVFSWAAIIGFLIALLALVPVDRARQVHAEVTPSVVEE